MYAPFFFTLFIVFALMSGNRVSAETFFGYVNGGYSEDSNTWIHEQEILAFQNLVFKDKPATILSASGAGAKFVESDGDGHFVRKPDGYVSLRESAVGEHVLSANMDTVTDLYRGLAAKHASEALLVYGDHGSEKGLSLWNGSALTPEDHFRLQNTVPSSTLLRSIYTQCFGGTLLVDPARTLPSSLAEAPAYLDRYYPAKRCGLALSRHDEMGQYFTRGTTWQRV